MGILLMGTLGMAMAAAAGDATDVIGGMVEKLGFPAMVAWFLLAKHGKILETLAANTGEIATSLKELADGFKALRQEVAEHESRIVALEAGERHLEK